MKFFFSVVISFFSSVGFLKAQFKASLTSGFSLNAGNKTDSVFFANNNGTFSQLNASYFWGRIGLGIKGSTLNHKPMNNFLESKQPNLDSIRNPIQSGGGIRSNALMMGPEICICKKNIKITPTFKLGAIFHNANTVKIVSELFIDKRYETTVDNKTSFGVNPAMTVAYKFNKKLGVALQLDYWRFNVKAKIIDFRRGLNNPTIVNQPQRLLNIGLGIYGNL